jgi:hypothetical protein
MNFTVYDGLYAYAKKANSGLYLACRTSVFNNPADQIYTPKGRITKVRQYESGKAGSYNKARGWMQSYGTGKGVQWIDYRAPFDRAKVLAVDAVDELQSFAAGMTPSIELLNGDFLDNQLPAEIDATNIAQFYSKIPAANRHVNNENGYKTDVDNILNTVLGLQNKIFNSGYDRDSVLFMRSSVYTNFQKAIIKNYGLASGAMISKTMTVNINTGLEGLITNAGDALSVTVDFEAFGKFLVINMPDDRMYTKIIMLDGYSEGQEDGGYVPDYDSDDFAQIDLLAIPIEAAFTNTRYMVDNFLVPASMPGLNYSKVDLRKLNERMYGNVEIGYAGINQKANAFEYDVRAIYGGDIFDNRARNCFAVTGVVGDQTVDSITVTGAGGATTITEKGGTLLMSAYVLPETAIDKTVTWSVATLDGGTATISATGLLTATGNGTVTVTATANDGTGVTGTLVITISNQTEEGNGDDGTGDDGTGGGGTGD